MFDSFFGWIGGLLDTLHGFFSHVFNYLKRTVLPFIIRRYQAIEVFLNKHLGPIVRFLQRVRAWYFKHIFPIQHAILEVIARVRVALAVFRALGFKWAAKLDADLQKLQSWVTASIQDILKPLNLIQNYLALMLDPAMILRKDFFSGTLFSSLASLKRAVAFGNSAPLTAEQQQAQADDRSLLNPATPIAFRGVGGNVQLSDGFAAVVAAQRVAAPDYLAGRQ
jgi:hypothetical protein